MDRTEKIQKLINLLDDLEGNQQAVDYLTQEAKDQVKKLKLTKKDYDIAEELGYELEQWLQDLDIT